MSYWHHKKRIITYVNSKTGHHHLLTDFLILGTSLDSRSRSHLAGPVGPKLNGGSTRTNTNEPGLSITTGALLLLMSMKTSHYTIRGNNWPWSNCSQNCTSMDSSSGPQCPTWETRSSCNQQDETTSRSKPPGGSSVDAKGYQVGCQ